MKINNKTPNETTTAANVFPFSIEEQEIMKCIDHAVLEHSRLKKAYDAVKMVIAENAVLSEPSHLLVVGDSGCGKTTLCDIFEQELDVKNDSSTFGLQRITSAIMASVPSPVTPRFLATTLLQSLKVHTALNGTSKNLTDQLIVQIQQCNVKAIFLDEAQHFYSLGLSGNGTPHKHLRQILDWIKSVINQSGVTFILMGMPTLLDLIRTDEQLARRFSRVQYLKPLDRPDENDKETISELAKFADDMLSIICKLPYFDSYDSFSANSDNALRLYLATTGTPARVKKLIRETVQFAYRNEDRHIAMDHFAQTHKPEETVNSEISRINVENQLIEKTLARTVSGTHINPFTLDATDLFSISNQVRI